MYDIKLGFNGKYIVCFESIDNCATDLNLNNLLINCEYDGCSFRFYFKEKIDASEFYQVKGILHIFKYMINSGKRLVV